MGVSTMTESIARTACPLLLHRLLSNTRDPLGYTPSFPDTRVLRDFAPPLLRKRREKIQAFLVLTSRASFSSCARKHKISSWCGTQHGTAPVQWFLCVHLFTVVTPPSRSQPDDFQLVVSTIYLIRKLVLPQSWTGYQLHQVRRREVHGGSVSSHVVWK